MSAGVLKLYYIVCDLCELPIGSSTADMRDSERDARRLAERRGWTTLESGSDICPNCYGSARAGVEARGRQ